MKSILKFVIAFASIDAGCSLRTSNVNHEGTCLSDSGCY